LDKIYRLKEESSIRFVTEMLKTSYMLAGPLRLLCFVNHTHFSSNLFQFVF